MAPLHYHWEWFLDAPAQRVWPQLSDTDRLNRALGMPPVDWKMEAAPDGTMRRTGSFRIKGILLAWEELPFEWREGQGFSVVRSYTKGPLRRMAVSVRLERVGTLERKERGTDEATRAIWDVELEAVHLLVAPLLQVMGSDLGRGLDQFHKRLDQQLRGFPAVAFPPEPVELRPEAPARIAGVAQELQRLGFESEWVARLVSFVKTASAADAQRVRPFALADQWDMPRVEALKLFLHATRLGLLDLSWEVVCPSCRGGKPVGPSLQALGESAHCVACDCHFEADFSGSVELTFRPNAAIRKVEHQIFCIGGPQNTPHVVAQALLGAGGTAAWDLFLVPGAYRLRGIDAGSPAAIEVVAGGRAAAPAVVELGATGFAAGAIRLEGPEVKLQVRNAGDVRRLVLLERAAWADHAVRADFVSTLPDFRALFSDQVLAPGVRVRVASLAFLFTDLKSSTAMYEEQGDAKAFALVRDHFKVLEEPIAAEGGSVVKTIGDAIMAVFPDAAACFRAGVAVQQGITAYNARSGEVPLVVKAGAHVGPCLAVNLNDTLDYFGTTVNMAARVQGESVGEDFVLTDAMVEDPGVARLLAEKPYEVDCYGASLKGLSGSFTLTRLWPLRLERTIATGTAPPAISSPAQGAS